MGLTVGLFFNYLTVTHTNAPNTPPHTHCHSSESWNPWFKTQALLLTPVKERHQTQADTNKVFDGSPNTAMDSSFRWNDEGVVKVVVLKAGRGQNPKPACTLLWQ